MKKITCIIKPYRLDDVIDAIRKNGITDMIIDEVRGYGRQKGHLHLYRESENQLKFIPKVSIELLVEDVKVESLVEAVCAAARTGLIGDGKIFVETVAKPAETSS